MQGESLIGTRRPLFLDAAVAAELDSKVVFVSYAIEDQVQESLFREQEFRTREPFVFVDLAVKRLDDEGWLRRARHRIIGSDAVIALVSANSAASDAQAWELRCARGAGKQILGVWADSDDAITSTGITMTRWGDPQIAAFIEGVQRCKPAWGRRPTRFA